MASIQFKFYSTLPIHPELHTLTELLGLPANECMSILNLILHEVRRSESSGQYANEDHPARSRRRDALATMLVSYLNDHHAAAGIDSGVSFDDRWTEAIYGIVWGLFKEPVWFNGDSTPTPNPWPECHSALLASGGSVVSKPAASPIKSETIITTLPTGTSSYGEPLRPGCGSHTSRPGPAPAPSRKPGEQSAAAAAQQPPSLSPESSGCPAEPAPPRAQRKRKRKRTFSRKRRNQTTSKRPTSRPTPILNPTPTPTPTPTPGPIPLPTPPPELVWVCM